MKKIEDFVSNSSFHNWVKNSNKEDKIFWENWILQHPEQKEDIEIAASIILGIKFNKVEGLSNKEIKSRFAKLNELLDNNQRRMRVAASKRNMLYRIAAVFIGVAVLGFVLWNFASNESTRTYKTGFGEIAHIDLPDGSEVTLNSNSSLIINKEWNNNQSREVWLEGEAFFKVEKQPKMVKSGGELPYVKFIVHASDLNVEVIGTRFNVHNRGQKTQVVLSSGKIKLTKILGSDTTNIMMNSGDLVRLSDASKEYEKHKVNPEIYTSWRNKKLIFDNTPLSEIIIILEDNYGLKVTIKDTSLAERKLTGELSVEDVDDLINALSKSFNIKITRNNKELVLDKY